MFLNQSYWIMIILFLLLFFLNLPFSFTISFASKMFTRDNPTNLDHTNGSDFVRIHRDRMSLASRTAKAWSIWGAVVLLANSSTDDEQVPPGSSINGVVWWFALNSFFFSKVTKDLLKIGVISSGLTSLFSCLTGWGIPSSSPLCRTVTLEPMMLTSELDHSWRMVQHWCCVRVVWVSAERCGPTKTYESQ